jgi:hypothetical protein
MTYTISFTTINGLPAGHDWIEHCSLPDIPGISTVPVIADALDHVTTQRKSIAVVGEKGAGKSDALEAQLDAYAELQRAKEALDGTYRRQRVLLVQTLRAKSYRDALVELLKLVVGPNVATTVRGRRKLDDELRLELVHAALEQNYVAIVLEEAEVSPAPVFELLRDIVSDSYARDPKRKKRGSRRAPAGIAVLMVGTPHLRGLLDKSSEAGERWTQIAEIAPPAPAAVPGIYLTWFPRFADHVTKISEQAWANFISTCVTRGRPVSLRTLENHARRYIRRIARAHREVTALDQVPFVEEVFLYTLREEYARLDQPKA